MATVKEIVHVISRKDPKKHQLITCNVPATPLGPSSVRCKITSIAFTSNNYTYATRGSILGWWDIVPLPSDTASQLDKPEEYGLLMAWGYARVVESTVSGLPVGSLLHGAWVASPHSIEMNLESGDTKGHWAEVSEHRKIYPSTFRRYVQYLPAIDHKGEGADIMCKPLLEPAILLSDYNFPPDETQPCNPMPPLGKPWSKEDADLTHAVAVILSASSKSGRAFAWQLQRNRVLEKNGPLALLQASASTASVLDYSGRSALASKTVDYAVLSTDDTLSWLSSYNPRRVVVFDFGAKTAVLEAFAAKVRSTSAVLTHIGIGNAANVSGTALAVPVPNIERVHFNTADVRDYAVSIQGGDTYFGHFNESYERFVKDGGTEGIEVDIKEGVQGVFDAWTELADGNISSRRFTVAKLDASF